MATPASYDRERAKRYKKWWARQKGSPQGELIEVPSDSWSRRDKRPDAAKTPEPGTAEGQGS